MTERSLWGWGLAERFPDRDTRVALAAHAANLLGFSPGEATEPSDSIKLSDSKISAPTALSSLFSADPVVRARHSYGRAYRDLVRGFSGDFTSAPDLVAFPEDESQIGSLLDWCNSSDAIVVPFGGGTSVVGGVERPPNDPRAVVSLDLSRLNRVVQVDPISRSAEIQAGALGPHLEAQLARHGLTLRHYPQSFEFSTLGGWIATRAGGHYATLRTRIDDFVESVRMITPFGLWESRRLPSSGAGPSADRWVLGSEGTLGVISSAWVRVTERPKWRARANVHFAALPAAAEAARKIVQAGLFPANCRALDPLEAKLTSVTKRGTAILLLAFESADHEVEPDLRRAMEIARSFGGELPEPPRISSPDGDGGTSPSDADRWREAFFAGPYLQNIMVSLGVIADTFETACTWDRFPQLHAGVIEAVEDALRRICGGGRVTCRLTHVYSDGPAPYFTFLGPARRGSELAQWNEIKHAASEAVLRLGGTITHHHAVGRTHRPWYDRERPEPFAVALRAAKRAVDPKNILNPGVLIDL